MKLVSINTGRPKDVHANGRIVRTSIWKSPREGRLRVTASNVDGDAQSDLAVHGGTYKAVYFYPSEHYEYWRRELPDADLPWGVFGENFTTEGLLETDVRIGYRLAIGSAQFLVTQPRQPCFKLGIRFGREDMLKRFVASGRSGFYVSIVTEGEVGWGDRIRITRRAADSITVADIFAMKMNGGGDRHALARAASLDVLTPSWREHFLARLSSR